MENINELFHTLANEGKEINDFRVHHQQLAHRHRSISKLPAKKIEFAIQLEKLKQNYNGKQ